MKIRTRVGPTRRPTLRHHSALRPAESRGSPDGPQCGHAATTLPVILQTSQIVGRHEAGPGARLLDRAGDAVGALDARREGRRLAYEECGSSPYLRTEPSSLDDARLVRPANLRTAPPPGSTTSTMTSRRPPGGNRAVRRLSGSLIIESSTRQSRGLQWVAAWLGRCDSAGHDMVRDMKSRQTQVSKWPRGLSPRVPPPEVQY